MSTNFVLKTFFVLLISSELFASEVSKIRVVPDARKFAIYNLSSPDELIIRDYLKIHSDYSKKFCPGGAEEKFNKLDKDYKGDGQYIPELNGQKFDRDTVAKFIPEIKNKLTWLKKEKTTLSKVKDLNPYFKKIDEIEKDLKSLLKLKERTIFLKGKKLEDHSKKAKIEYQKFAKKNLDFFDSISFLLSYRYPVDHFELRKQFDTYKGLKEDKDKKKANEIYFYRRLVQDGAQDKDNTKGDRFLRAIFDTLALHFKNNDESFIPDEVRVDVKYVLDQVEKQLKRGKVKLEERADEWVSRTERTLNFYDNLIKNKVFVADHFETAEQRIKVISEARDGLRDYVLQKQAETYFYFSEKTELMQALYVLETILYNEVGRVDGREALERRDVAQVVVNRFFIPYYSELHLNDSINPYLKGLTSEENPFVNSPWLNVLFKEGEFSFTYFFIGASLRIFCPDMSKVGQNLRRANLKIALELLRKPNFEFDAVRYFSRASMHGRIDMTAIWQEYQALPTRTGTKFKQQNPYKASFAKGTFNYLNHFESETGLYRVLEGRNETVIRRENDGEFLSYRNPHHFIYFKENYQKFTK